jgi:hypothetical protein
MPEMKMLKSFADPFAEKNLSADHRAMGVESDEEPMLATALDIPALETLIGRAGASSFETLRTAGE